MDELVAPIVVGDIDTLKYGKAIHREGEKGWEAIQGERMTFGRVLLLTVRWSSCRRRLNSQR